MIEHQLLGAGLGAIIGAVLALTGAGGGILAVPLLVFGLGLSMVEAAPVGLLAVGLAAAVGAVLGLRQVLGHIGARNHLNRRHFHEGLLNIKALCAPVG